MQQILYAFWDYDLCPYMLGGVVKELTLSGRVRVEGYDGLAFKPIAILPEKAGRDALQDLKDGITVDEMSHVLSCFEEEENYLACAGIKSAIENYTETIKQKQ